MTRAHVMVQSRAIPVEVGTAFARTLSVSLPTIFSRWYGPIGPVKAIRDQAGDWTTVGQTRTVVQVGGGILWRRFARQGLEQLSGELLG